MSTTAGSVEGPPSKRQKTKKPEQEATTDDVVLCGNDELKWLISNYAGNRSIAVKFGTDDQEYFFPERTLVDNFQYFEGALRKANNKAVFTEGCTDIVHLQDVTAGAFARLFKFIQAKDYFYDGCGDVDHVLQAIITADYLGLENVNLHETKFVEHLRLILLKDRRTLTLDHLRLVLSHKAFKKTRVWDVFAWAGVRPYLQESMLDIEYENARTMDPSELPTRFYDRGQFPVTWFFTLQHYRELRRGMSKYAAGIMENVALTLRKGRKAQKKDGIEYCENGRHMPAPEYLDPLGVPYASRHGSGGGMYTENQWWGEFEGDNTFII